MSSSDVAFLIYQPLKQRQQNNSFEGNYNIGANVNIDILRRNGVECDLCTPETANNYRVVLVSFTSEYDCLAYIKAVSLIPYWQRGKRQFIVVGGGPGLQNPISIRDYLDYGVFGRSESIIVDLVNTVLGGGVYSHKSVMNLPDVHSVKMAQATELYPYDIDLGGGRGCRQWKESFIGCPNKCLFCHYTWARKRVGSGTYYQGDLTMKRSVEVLWKDIPTIITKKEGRIRTAIDGFSERLRFAYGKKITNQDIVDGINHIGSFDGITVVLTYNISNMPGETQGDRDEFYATVKRANPKHRVIVVLQSTPFRPSILTPLQYAPVSLYPATSDLSAQVIHDSDNLRVMHSFSNESPYSQLMTIAVSRATGKKQSDDLIRAICFHPKLNGKSKKSIRLIDNTFDLVQYLREYTEQEQLPAWFLSSYTNHKVLHSMYQTAKAKVALPIEGDFVGVR